MTPLYSRMFEVLEADKHELMHKVWDPTPWIINVETLSPSTEEGIRRWDIMRDWLISNIGVESYTIHGYVGAWHRGGATVCGWTFFGFATEDMMHKFVEQFKEYTC